MFALAIVEVALRLFPSLIPGAYHPSRAAANLELHDGERHFCTGPRIRAQAHDILRSTEVPNSSYIEFKNDVASFHSYNEYGFRGSFEARKQNVTIVLGDSFTRGTLADDTETIPALLSDWSQDTSYINIGVSGWGTTQQALAYKLFQEKFAGHPQKATILLFYVVNDLQDNLEFKNWQDDGTRQGLERDPSTFMKFRIAVQKALDSFRLYQFAQLMFSNLRRYQKFYASDPTPEELALTEAALKNLVEMTKANGSRLVVFAIPDEAEVYDGKQSYRQDPKHYDDLVRGHLKDWSQKYGYDLVDLVPPLRAVATAKADNAAPLFGYPDGHFTEYGYGVIASFIFDWLNDNQIEGIKLDRPANLMQIDPAHAACPS